MGALARSLGAPRGSAVSRGRTESPTNFPTRRITLLQSFCSSPTTRGRPYVVINFRERIINPGTCARPPFDSPRNPRLLYYNGNAELSRGFSHIIRASIRSIRAAPPPTVHSVGEQFRLEGSFSLLSCVFSDRTRRCKCNARSV